MARYSQLLFPIVHGCVLAMVINVCCWQAASSAPPKGPMSIVCTPAVQTVQLGGTAMVVCDVTFLVPLDLSITHVPRQSANMAMQRTRRENGYRFSVFIYKVSEENNRQYCLQATNKGLTVSACYSIVVDMPLIQAEEPQPLPPKPEIIKVYTTRSSVVVAWRHQEAPAGVESFQTDVSVSTAGFSFRKPVMPKQNLTIFTHLQPNQMHTITVETRLGSQTQASSLTVRTTPSLRVQCESDTNVLLKPYKYGLEKPTGAQESFRVKCAATIEPTGIRFETPKFLKTRLVRNGTQLRIVARRLRNIGAKHNGTHCIVAHADHKAATQACFRLNVTRPLAAAIQTVCRSRDCTAPSLAVAGPTKKVIGCYVTGFPLPTGQVTWTYDGKPLSTSTQGAWFRKTLGCRMTNGPNSDGEVVRICKIKVNSRGFLGIDPGLLKCSATNSVGSRAETSAPDDLVNKTE